MAFILVVDDDPFVREALSAMLRCQGHEPAGAGDLRSARRLLAKEPFELVFLDVNLPDGQGLSLMPEIRTGFQAAEVLVITATNDQAMGEAAILAGAFDYIEKPLTKDSIVTPLAKALEYRQNRLVQHLRPKLATDDMIGVSPALMAACDAAAQAALSDAPVLVSGESGTGKELLARAIHRTSARRSRGFVVVDCAALPETLLEGVLFGHVKGAFTGADRDREGLVLQADGGTLFLDEVGELPLSAQKGFLRVLQEKTFRPIGAKTEQKSDFRLVAATNRDLAAMVREGSFREDLYFRIQAQQVHLPALRLRGDDVVLLAEHVARTLVVTQGLSPKIFSADFRSAILAYNWPGNVRELRHAIERTVLSHRQAEVIYARDLPGEVRAAAWMAERSSTHALLPPTGQPVAQAAEAFAMPQRADPLPSWKAYRRRAVQSARREYVARLKKQCGGDMSAAKIVSCLSQSRLYDLLREEDEE